MSNLGPYQEFVTDAARMGGVENMIRTIESGAIAKAAPVLLVKGAGIGPWPRWRQAASTLVGGGRGPRTRGVLALPWQRRNS